MDQAMTNREVPHRVRNRVSIQQVARETLVYDEQRHKAFCLNETSSVIWRLVDGERTVAQIGVAATVELNTPVAEEVVSFALEELRRNGLIVSPAAPVVSRRVALRRLGVGGALLLPAVAAIVAPTAAQAYSGCVDCTPSFQSPASVRAGQPARARARQQTGVNPALNGLDQPISSPDDPQ